jgi:hypothetical protein
MKNLFLYCFIPVFVFTLLFAGQVFGANFYNIDSSIELISEGESESFGSMRLVLEPSKKTGVVEAIDFFAADNKQLFGRLTFSPAKTISWQGPGESDQFFQAENLFIAPGFSLPLDILPVQRVLDSDTGLIVHEFQRKSGSRVFLDRVKIFVQPVKYSDAKENGWLRYYKNHPDNLFLICARRVEAGDLIVQQLWEPDGAWWIFEETLFRQSWRLFE